MKKAFTMIELIFVIVILGILASVAIPRLAATRTDAEIATTVANLRTLVSDASTYYVIKGKFAEGADGVKWNEITNVPLTDADKPAVGAVRYLTIDGQRCIGLELNNRLSAAIPARITFSKIGTNQSGVCKQVLDTEPVKAYFNSKAGPLPSAIPIGSSISIYRPSTGSTVSTGSSSTTPSTGPSTPSKPSKPSSSRPTPAVSTANGPATVTIVVPAEKPTTTPKPSHSAASMDGSTVIHGSGNSSGNKDVVNSILGVQQQRPRGSGRSVATIRGQSSQQVSKEEEEAANKEWIESGKKDEDMEKFKDALQQMMKKK